MPYVTKSAYQKLVAAARQNRRSLRRISVLEREADIDSLTGLHRRQALNRAIERECNRCARSIETGRGVEPITLVFIDIDLFKRVNDRFGHQVGDKVLVAVARTIKRCLRTYDLAVRWGGEEIVVLLPATDAIGGGHVAERIRRSVEALVIRAPDKTRVQATVSAGVASIDVPLRSRVVSDDLLNRADQALYRAKNEGRNRVCSAAPAPV